MSDKILLITPNSADVFDLIPKSNKDENGLDIVHPMPEEGEYLSLVDVETEKIYKWPKEMIPPYDILDGKLLSLTDNKGNIYFTTGDFSYNQIYKLDISNFTIQSIFQFYTYHYGNKSRILPTDNSRTYCKEIFSETI